MGNSDYRHVPVMLKEVLEYLDPKPGEYFIDCTLGGGGYTMAIAKMVDEKGKVLAIDLDKMAIENAKLKVKSEKLNNVILAHDNFKNLSKIVQEYFKDQTHGFSGIVFDLGLSSAQLEDRSRGFSFKSDSSLDMAFGHKRGMSRIYVDTQMIVNRWSREELEKIIREYGEERFARRIAEKIVEYRKVRPVETTGQLVEIIKSAIPAKYQHGPIHFATRVFQALRIATNEELENLREALPQAVDLIKKGGRIAVISYHSLEDRIVKNFFKLESKDCVCPPEFPLCRCGHKAKIKILTSKAAMPSEEEIKKNPRARSAKMRVAERK